MTFATQREAVAARVTTNRPNHTTRPRPDTRQQCDDHDHRGGQAADVRDQRRLAPAVPRAAAPSSSCWSSSRSSPSRSGRPATIISILVATAVNGVLAMGVTFVIITGGIDLSVGTSMTFASVMHGSWS